MRESAPTGSSGSTALIAPALILLSAVIAYHGSFGVPFFFDDLIAITNNPTIQSLGRIGDVLSPPADGGGVTGRPIVNLSLAVNHAMSGTDVRDYHVFNLLVHALSALTLFGLVRRTLVQPALRARFGASASSLAFLIALLWTVHPLQTESVTCVIQRTELLVGMFYLLTLYSFVRAAEEPPSRTWPALAVVSSDRFVSGRAFPSVKYLQPRRYTDGKARAAWASRP